MSGLIQPEAATVRDVEVITQLKPYLPQIRTVLDELLGRTAETGEDMRMDDPVALDLPELVGDELVELRQTHGADDTDAPRTSGTTHLNAIQNTRCGG